MTLYHALLLGLLQGTTEFLPISSSGHLALLEHYLKLPFGPKVLQHYDIVLHGGSLLALLLYFWKTWWRILQHPFRKEHDGGPPMLLILIVGTIPAAIFGLLAEDWLEAHTRSLVPLAIGFLITGAFLLLSGYYEENHSKRGNVVGWAQVLGMGIGQAFAIVPSVSRSGLTIASGRFLGLSAHRSAEVTFLLGTPALAGAVLLTFLKGKAGLTGIGEPPLLVGFLASFGASLLVMHLFLQSIKRYGVWMWAAYLFLIGVLVLGDAFFPLLERILHRQMHLPLRFTLTILFVVLFLEAAPVTSLFIPGFTTMVALGLLLQGNPLAILACIPVGTLALLLGGLLGYLPAKQAREKIHWREKFDQKLHRAERFFRKWGTVSVIVGGWYGPTRAFMSIAAGLGEMPIRKYILATIFGSLVWVTVVMGSVGWIGKAFL